MKIFPAIDILDGRAVRLVKGLRSEVTVYGDPVERAHMIAATGSKFLHIVDLNAAFDGTYVNEDILKEIAKIKGLTVQLGGGIRNLARAAYTIEQLGIPRAIVGSVLVDDRLTEQLFARFGSAIVGGLDVKDGRLAVKGWVDTIDATPLSVALKIKQMGCTDVVFTDVSRDGTMTGVNVALTQQLQEQSGINVIASGGLASISDIVALKQRGIYGAILGKSMYSGAIDLKEAISYVD